MGDVMNSWTKLVGESEQPEKVYVLRAALPFYDDGEFQLPLTVGAGYRLGIKMTAPVDVSTHRHKRGGFSYSMTKRIHTCAFMRRLGLPIGLCFSGKRPRTRQPRPRPEPAEYKPSAYSYLEDHWPVHSFLGGAVGR